MNEFKSVRVNVCECEWVWMGVSESEYMCVCVCVNECEKVLKIIVFIQLTSDKSVLLSPYFHVKKKLQVEDSK